MVCQPASPVSAPIREASEDQQDAAAVEKRILHQRRRRGVCAASRPSMVAPQQRERDDDRGRFHESHRGHHVSAVLHAERAKQRTGGNERDGA